MRFEYLVMIFVGYAVAAAVAGLWREALGALVVAGATAATVAALMAM